MTDLWTKRSDGSTVWSDRQGNVSAPVTWTTLTRPSSPFDGQTGKNTDFNGLETYNSATGKWKVMSGNWTTLTRPTGVDVGSMGVNTDTGYGLEMFYGPAETEWQLL
jgi:hypothetical protein